MQNRGTCCLKNTVKIKGNSRARKSKEIASLIEMRSTLKVP